MRRAVALALLTLALLTLAALVPAVPAARAGDGFFNIRCERSHESHDDPIVYPGVAGAAHLHEFLANTSTAFDSTFTSMTDAKTTCALSKDTSGYWIPALLDTSGQPVPIRKVLIYYRAKSEVKVRAFPANLKVITGGDTTNPPAPSRSQNSLSWACGDNAPYVESPPDCSGTGYHVSAHIHFPDCWDGEHRDSADHRSHMAFGTPECEAGWIAMPRLRLHVEFDVTNAEGYTLASDMGEMMPGQSLHADFWSTWKDRKALRFLVGHCLNDGRSCSQMTDRKLRRMGFRS
ncbi:MAG TPA: DUF1996 domain-containing protein [Actinomycetota bacterium]|nr:DUF1996 domain-containing protein [Actinomycetota bacterium]